MNAVQNGRLAISYQELIQKSDKDLQELDARRRNLPRVVARCRRQRS